MDFPIVSQHYLADWIEVIRKQKATRAKGITIIEWYEEEARISAMFTSLQRASAVAHNKRTALDAWKKNRNWIKKKTDDPLQQITILESWIKSNRGYGWATEFPVAIGFHLMKKLKAWGAESVLDPCAGWGDRAICAHAANLKYVGVDVNSTLTEPYAAISSATGAQFIIDSFINMNADALLQLNGGKYDCVVTSPPFYDLEKYSADANQSTNVFTTYASWFDGFMVALINLCFAVLKSNGKICLYIKDYYAHKLQGDVVSWAKQQGYQTEVLLYREPPATTRPTTL